MSKVVSALFLGAAAAVSAPCMAQAQTPVQDQSAAAAKTKAAEQNEIICEQQEVTGSRLAKKRVCMTRAQWAASRLQDRQAIEKVQVQGRMPGE